MLEKNFNTLKETLTWFSRNYMYPERRIREKYYTEQDNKLTDFHMIMNCLIV